MTSRSRAPKSQVCDLEGYVTDMHWFPAGKGGGSTGGNDVFACSFSDGCFRILTRGGRVERHVPDAHRGACVSLRWNPDGTALATCGEDGALKTWGRNGMLRAVLEQLQHAIHAISWSPSCDAVAAGCGKDLYVKSADPGGRKTIRWKAHDGAVLAVDWSPRGDVIVSGGEDCRYRVWDAFGRTLYASPTMDHPTTSCAWAPRQGTPIHDHSSWGVVAAVTNRVIITGYRREDDGETPGFADVVEVSRLLVSESSYAFLRPPEDLISKIENPYRDPAVTLHVFGDVEPWQNMYDPPAKTVTPLEPTESTIGV